MRLREADIVCDDAGEEFNVDTSKEHIETVVDGDADVEVGPKDRPQQEVGDQNDCH